MNTDFHDAKYKDLTEKIIKIFYKVYNNLGYGFLEKVYENEVIGEYFADILVDNKVIVEIKASKSLAVENEAQLLNYLKATDIEVGLLLNFGPKPDFKRKVFDNIRK
ncbi:MAG: hypothetical protein MAG551_01117 [Candidatus Scalindua arabica]|uniref:GxxExxY protein n=1 Tax=Candidatus Scalindua arabica TaxID=1127984 RepID=A0A941W1W1_9BACT|nr:hypothetical protein [Candidatus Scalindua arabica]